MQQASVVAGLRRLLTALFLVPAVLMLAALALPLLPALLLGLAGGFRGVVTMFVPGALIFTTGLALAYATWRFDKSTTWTRWLAPAAAAGAFFLLSYVWMSEFAGPR